MVPVAIFTYNRWQNLSKTLKCLKNNKIELLYIFSDGPKNFDDEKKVNKVRKILDGVNWVEVRKVYQAKNLGLSNSIISGVRKVLSEYESVICVEDDVCVSEDFYGYMKACLEKYKDRQEVAGVTGLRYPFLLTNIGNYDYDIFFSPRFSSWGWGTWRRFWQTVDFNKQSLAAKMESVKIDKSLSGNDMPAMIESALDEKSSGSWDVLCGINMLLNQQSFVWPLWNMVENSGLGRGTHAGWRPIPWKLQWEKKRTFNIDKINFPESEQIKNSINTTFINFLNNPGSVPFWKKTIYFLVRKLKNILKKI